MLQFDVEEAARTNTDRREPDRSWANVCAVLDVEVTVKNGASADSNSLQVGIAQRLRIAITSAWIVCLGLFTAQAGHDIRTGR